jgi:hypothetical protein
MDMQIWIVGPSQAVPDNYRSLVINDALIDWLSARPYVAGALPAGGVGPFGDYVGKPTNYDAVVATAANEAGGRGFVTELAAPTSQYRDKVWSSLDTETFTALASQSYVDGIDAIFAAHAYYGGWDGFKDAVAGATTLPVDVTIDDFGSDPAQYRGVVEVDSARLFELIELHVLKPVADAAQLFAAGPYLTRLYSSMSADEMTVDPVFNYNADLAQVSNVHIAKQLIECDRGRSREQAPWRMELPQGGVIAGQGQREWPLALGSMPANLTVVELSTSGSGHVVEDNTEEIRERLFEASGTIAGRSVDPQPTQNGLLIGGTQTLFVHAPSSTTQGRLEPSDSGRCSVSRVGAGGGAAFVIGPLLAGVLRTLRRRWPYRSGGGEG